MSVNELSELKDEYGTRCTVLHQGELTNVTVRLSTLGCSLKFQLTSKQTSCETKKASSYNKNIRHYRNDLGTCSLPNDLW